MIVDHFATILVQEPGILEHSEHLAELIWGQYHIIASSPERALELLNAARANPGAPEYAPRAVRWVPFEVEAVPQSEVN